MAGLVFFSLFLFSSALFPREVRGYCWKQEDNPGFTGPPEVTQVIHKQFKTKEGAQMNLKRASFSMRWPWETKMSLNLVIIGDVYFFCFNHTWAHNGHFLTVMVGDKPKKRVHYYIRFDHMHGDIPTIPAPPCPCVPPTPGNQKATLPFQDKAQHVKSFLLLP